MVSHCLTWGEEGGVPRGCELQLALGWREEGGDIGTFQLDLKPGRGKEERMLLTSRKARGKKKGAASECFRLQRACTESSRWCTCRSRLTAFSTLPRPRAFISPSAFLKSTSCDAPPAPPAGVELPHQEESLLGQSNPGGSARVRQDSKAARRELGGRRSRVRVAEPFGYGLCEGLDHRPQGTCTAMHSKAKPGTTYFFRASAALSSRAEADASPRKNVTAL